MPDILIRGMEMPESCADCPICYDMMECSVSPLRFWNGRTELEQFEFCNERHPSCPLHELPEHRDLIDRDALLAKYERDERAADEHGREFSFSFESGGARCTEWWIVQQKLMDAPVIVPASEEDG